MRNSLAAFDLWLIERVFEPFLWRLELRTGWNNFAAARVILSISVAVDVVKFVNTGGLVFAAISGFTAIFFYFGTILHERLLSGGRDNMYRSDPTMRLFRLSGFVLLVYPPFGFLKLIGDCAFICVFYAISCNSMPPGWTRPATQSKGRLLESMP